MQRKNNVNEINLKIDEIIFGGNGHLHDGGFKIRWSSDIGFGEYTIVKMKDGTLEADTELMDSNDDKAFGKKLMELLVEKLNIR